VVQWPSFTRTSNTSLPMRSSYVSARPAARSWRTGIHDRTDALNTYCTSALGESCRNTADRGNQLRARVV
jgi:hypothetical protein